MSLINLKTKLKTCLFMLFFLILGMLLSNLPVKNPIKQNISQISINASLNHYEVYLGHPYNWIDASSGINLILGDDDSASTILPFNFTFYDCTFEKIHIITEGYLTFSFKSVQTSGAIPSSHPHRQKIIAPYWTNLDGTSGNIFIKNFSSYWVAAWENFSHDNGSYAGSFEVILHNNGDIVFNYDILENVSTYACGLNYGDGNNYSSYDELTSGVNDFSIKFSLTVENGGNGGFDNNIINIVVGMSVTLGIVSTVGIITLYFYKKNPEQFKAKFSKGKEQFKEIASRFKKKLKNGLVKSKEQIKKEKNRIKGKTPKNE